MQKQIRDGVELVFTSSGDQGSVLLLIHGWAVTTRPLSNSKPSSSTLTL